MESKVIIIFDVSRLVKRLLISTPTGIDRVDFEYVRHIIRSEKYQIIFTAQGKKSHFVLPKLYMRWFANLVLLFGDEEVENRHEKYPCLVLRPLARKVLLWIFSFYRWANKVGLTLHPQELLRRASGVNAYYLNISHAKLLKPERFAWLAESEVTAVFFLHDLIPIRYPEYCTKKQESRHRRRMRTISSFADIVFVNSQHTLNDAREYFQDEGIRAPEFKMVGAGGNGLKRPQRSADEKDYFVVLSTIEPRKNHLTLLRVWKRISKDFGNQCPKLIIIGARGWGNDEVFSILDENINNRVFEYSGLSDEQVAEFLVGAAALLSPSFAEGYGLPVVEALSLGVPVIASNISSHLEIGQDVPDFAEADDEDAWYELVLDYSIRKSGKREAQLRRMKDYVFFTWRDHMSLVDELLEQDYPT